MQYLTNEAINSAYVYDWQNGKEINVYNEEAMNTRAPYDLFLGGSLSLITIENDKAGNDRELIVFRDSFGSSMIPLLISGYSKITIVDIRYLSGDRLESFIDFHGQDIAAIGKLVTDLIHHLLAEEDAETSDRTLLQRRVDIRIRLGERVELHSSVPESYLKILSCLLYPYINPGRA